jgi:hypothetical protein
MAREVETIHKQILCCILACLVSSLIQAVLVWFQLHEHVLNSWVKSRLDTYSLLVTSTKGSLYKHKRASTLHRTREPLFYPFQGGKPLTSSHEFEDEIIEYNTMDIQQDG